MMNEHLKQSMEPLERLLNELVLYAPKILLFLGVVLVGLILSGVIRRMTKWAVQRSGIESLAEKAGAAKLLYAVGIKKGTADVIATLAWACGILLTIAAGAELLGLSAVASGATIIMGFLPRLLATALVLLGGLAVATVLERVVERVGRKSKELKEPTLVSRLVYYIVMTVAVVMAADQAGLETELVSELVTIGVMTTMAGLALAFALGSRSAFQNIVAGHYFRGVVRVGDRVRVAGSSGIVLRYSPVTILLRTDDGSQLLLPFKHLFDEAIEIDPIMPNAHRSSSTSASTNPGTLQEKI